VALPHAAHAGRGHRQAALLQLIGDANLAEGRLLKGKRNDGVLNLLRHAVLQHRLLAADLLQRQLATLVVEFLEAIETIAAVAHHLAGLADVAELFGKLEQSDFGTDDLLFSRHGVLQSPRRGASPPQPLRAPPRLAIRRGEPGHRMSD
jgi:hypothetical protein